MIVTFRHFICTLYTRDLETKSTIILHKQVTRVLQYHRHGAVTCADGDHGVVLSGFDFGLWRLEEIIFNMVTLHLWSHLKVTSGLCWERLGTLRRR